eukprot:4008478-Alexandrium_andersonii.AAC.1
MSAALPPASFIRRLHRPETSIRPPGQLAAPPGWLAIPMPERPLTSTKSSRRAPFGREGSLKYMT